MPQEPPRLDIKERAEKRDRLLRLGADPYPPAAAQQKRASVLELAKRFASLNAGEKTAEKGSLAGRLMRRRDMGKAAFFNIQDESGSLQCYIKKQDFVSPAEGGHKAPGATAESVKQRELPPSPSQANSFKKTNPWELWKLCDIGDIVALEGQIFKTRKGELSLRVSGLRLLCKSLRSLPEKHHGLQDKELKYRFRHLDLIMASRSRAVFEIRSRVIFEIRSFMHKKGFMEVETPVLQPLYGGAEARPFETWFHRLNQKMYLKISPEIYLKKLLVGGFEKIFEIGKNFRNEGLDRSHNPEFTMMEYYEAYTDYEYQMAQFEELACCVSQAVNQWRAEKGWLALEDGGASSKGSALKFLYQGRKLDLTRPWMRISLQEFEQVVESAVLSVSSAHLKLLYPLGWTASAPRLNEKGSVKESALAPADFWTAACKAFQKRRQAFLQEAFDNKAAEASTSQPKEKLTDKALNSGFWKSFIDAILNARAGQARSTKAKSQDDAPSLPLKEKIEKMKSYTLFLDPKANLNFLTAFDHKGPSPRAKEGDSLSRAPKPFDKGSKPFSTKEPQKASPTLGEGGLKALELYHELSLKALELTVESFFWDPVFVTDFPMSVSPLTKQHRSQPGFVERFEPYIAGFEMGNAYTELNDPVEQRRRLKKQRRIQAPFSKGPARLESLPDKKSLSAHQPEDSPSSKSLPQPELAKERAQEVSSEDDRQKAMPHGESQEGAPRHPVDESFLQALETGMPPAGGVGLGVERLVMILSDQRSIKDSMLFPMLRDKPAK